MKTDAMKKSGHSYGGRFDINFCLTIIKIKGRITTYNPPIIIDKSDFVTSYLNVTQVFENLRYVEISTGDRINDSFQQFVWHIPASE